MLKDAQLPLIVITAFFLLSVTIKLIFRKKIVDSFGNYPIDKRRRILVIYSKLLKIYKFFLWTAPLQLIITPYLVYKYDPSNLAVIMVDIPIFIYVLADFYLKKTILKAYRENETEKISRHNQEDAPA